MWKSATITGITQATPVQITAPGHGIPNGWPAAVVGVNGMYDINAKRYPPYPDELNDVTVVDANTISINDVSSARWPAYISGGAVVWNTPQVLVGAAVTMTFWDNPDRAGTPLLMLTSTSGIAVDTNAFTISPLLQTTGLLWEMAYYDLDVTDAAGVVHNVFTGTFTID